jgi:predicted permease
VLEFQFQFFEIAAARIACKVVFGEIASGSIRISINAGLLSLIWIWLCILVGMFAALVYCLVYQDQVKSDRAAKLCPHQKEWFECAICASEIAGK